MTLALSILATWFIVSMAIVVAALISMARFDPTILFAAHSSARKASGGVIAPQPDTVRGRLSLVGME